jgi:photosystem II stability/assembly factor-like uncharacterized protein
MTRGTVWLIARLSVLAACLATGALVQAPAASGPATRPATRVSAVPEPVTDAALRDICFIDRLRGVAVGDGGVILRTEDAGERWVRVAAGTTACLERVFFQDARVGWAVGGLSRRLRPGGYGWVLKTTDGGATWFARTLPHAGWLCDVVFTSETEGWLSGGPTPEVPTGHLHTVDGGETWRSAAAQAVSPGDARSPGRPRLGMTDALPAQVCFRDAQTGLAVGSPDGKVRRTSDGGRTWEARETPASVPLHGVTFATPERCYAVGDLGTILRSSDAGLTWEVVHHADTQCSLLVVLAGPGAYPWTFLARYAGDQGYRTAVLDWTVFEREPERRWREAGLRQACETVGAAVTQTLPASLASEDALAAALTAAVQAWRPAVVVVASDGGNPVRSERALGAARRAFDRAATPVAHPPSGATAPLTAATSTAASWSVRRLAELAPAAEPEAMSRPRSSDGPRKDRYAACDGKVFSTRLGETYSMAGVRAAEAVRQRPTTVLHVDRLRIVRERSAPPAEGEEHLFRGVHVPTGEGRRVLAATSEDAEFAAERLTTAVQALWFAYLLLPSERGAAGRGGGGAEGRGLGSFLSVAGDFARAYPQTAEGVWALLTVGRRLEVQGDPGLAFLAYGGAVEASVGTAELPAWSSTFRPRAPFPAWGDPPGLAEALAAQVCYLLRGIRDPQLALYLDEALFDRERVMREGERQNQAALATAAERLQLLARRFPSDRSVPELDFRLAAGYRALGRTREALDLAMKYANWPDEAPYGMWARNARAELALSTRDAPPGKSVVVARRARRPPVLDGFLDDPCWRGEAHLLGPAPGNAHQAGIRVAYDDQALYVALEGSRRRWPTTTQPQAPGRGADFDYGLGDRVELLFDLARDYGSYVRFSVVLPMTATATLGGTRLDLGGAPVAKRPGLGETRQATGLENDGLDAGALPLSIRQRLRSSSGQDRFVLEWAVDLRSLEVYRVAAGTVWGVNAAVWRRDGSRQQLNGEAPLTRAAEFGYLVFE